MSSALSVMIVDDNREFAEAIRSFFAIRKVFSVLDIAHNSLEAMEMLAGVSPNIILLDLVMPQSDGFVLLEYLHGQEREHKPQIIVLTSLNHDAIIKKANEMGAVYYMAKPISLEDLHARCQDLVYIGAPSPPPKEPTKEKIAAKSVTLQQISSVVLSTGIPSHSKGYQYIIEAVDLISQSPDLIYHMTKQLYPCIGEKFETSAANVERSIRHAIELAWNNDRLQKANEIFRYIVFTPHHRPTNGEFISLIVNRIHAEEGRQQ